MHLKIGILIMLLMNINPVIGRRNGKRLIIKHIEEWIIIDEKYLQEAITSIPKPLSHG